MKVLIAEDEALSCALLDATLRRAGYTDIVATNDGEKALGLLQADPEIGLAILDWMMPGMDGLEVCRRVRDGENAWREIEHYVSQHSQARFSHGICGRCLEHHYPE